MLTELPDLSPLQVAARYVPASEAAGVDGDWYDEFCLPGRAPAIVVGDLAGHDIDAAVAMAQTRSILRALAVDRQEPPGQVLCRLDAVLAHLHVGRSGTCVYAQLDEHEDTWPRGSPTLATFRPSRSPSSGPCYVDTPPEVTRRGRRAGAQRGSRIERGDRG